MKSFVFAILLVCLLSQAANGQKQSNKNAGTGFGSKKTSPLPTIRSGTIIPRPTFQGFNQNQGQSGLTGQTNNQIPGQPGQINNQRPQPTVQGNNQRPQPTVQGNNQRPQPTVQGNNQRPQPTVQGNNQRPQPTVQGNNQRPQPTIQGNNQRPQPTVQGNNQRPQPTVQGNNQRPQPTVQGNNQRPQPTVQGNNQRPQPTVQGNNQRPQPTIPGNNQRPQPTVQGNNQRPQPTIQGNNQRPQPTVQGNNQRPQPTVQGNNQRPQPTVQGNNQRPQPTVQGNNQRPQPTVQGNNQRQQPTIPGNNQRPQPTVQGNNQRPQPTVQGNNQRPQPTVQGNNQRPQPTIQGNNRLPGQTGQTNNQSPGQTGQTNNQVPGQNRPGGVTLPGINIPGQSGQNVQRPSLPSFQGVSVTPPRPKMVFSCPRECPVCQKLKGTTTKVCQAADDFGDVKNDFLRRLSTDQSDAYDELKNTSAFVVTAATKTCDGMIRHINLFAKLSRAVKDKMHDFLNDPTTCSHDDVKKFPREMFAALDPVKGRRIFARMSPRQKAEVCKDLKYEDCLTRVYISKKIDCVKALLDNGNSLNVKDVSSLMDINNCSSWDRDTWNLTLRNFPKFLTADCIKETPTDIIMENLDKIGDSCGTMKSKERFAFVNATRTKMQDKKSQGTLTSQDKRDLSSIVSKCKSDPSTLQGILDPKDALKTTDLNTMSRSKGMKYMEQALQSMSPKDFTKDEIVNSIGVLVNDKKTLKQMNDSEIEAAACEVCSKKDDLNKNDLRKFADVVMDLPAFSDPSQFDSTTFDCMGCMMAYIPTSSFTRIPATQLRSAINSGTLKNMTITSKKMGKKVLENAKTALNKPNGDFSESDLKKLGSAVASFDSKDLDNIPDNSFTEDVIKEFDQALADDSGDKKSLKAKLIAKVSRQAGGLKKLMKTGLAKELPTSSIQDAPITDFDDLTGDNEESTITCNRKQAKFLMKKVKDTLGDTSNDNYTLKRLTNMKPYLNGLSVQDIKNMSQDSTYLDKMHTLGKAPDMNREQAKTIHKQIKVYTKFDETDSATLSSQTDSSTVSEMAPQVLALFSKTELKKFGMANCDAILDRLAEADTETMTKKEIQEKFDYFLECIGKTSGTITSDDLDKAGNMICGCSGSAVDRIDKDALEDKASTLQSCNLDSNSRKKLASNVVSKVFNSDLTQLKASGALVVGNLMSELSDAQLYQIDKDTLSDTADKVADAFKDKEDKEDKREKKGFKMDRTSSEKNSDKTKKKKVFKRILKAKEDIISAASSTSGRRKRSSVSLTCSDLQSLGSTGLSALSTTQISNLNDQEFIDCADLLGTPSDYSSSQKEALATVAKRTTVWGDPSGWNASNVYSAGSIVQALTTTEISALTLDLDAVSRLGTFDGWDDAKISQVFSRWLSLEKSNTPSSITSSELRSLGHVSCGATTGQIAQMSSSAYHSAADAVGEVTSCTDLQLYEYALLAKAAYGSDVTTWDSTTISNLGVVIGGLTGAEIATLSETQIDSIDANDMSYIPPSVFAGFTVSQINTFDTAQGQATTSSQRSALSTSQLDALSAAAGVSFASSGADARFAGFLLNTVLFIVTLAAYRRF